MSFVTISKPNCVPQWEIKKINQHCLVLNWVSIVINHNLDTHLIPTVQQHIKIWLEDENEEGLVLKGGEVY